ncbi:hypothetical protein GY45DRAFT_878406 [Cubamyces sp. BRFM 1775]|nr:hypothetical protein GY45DRAFT_878406 [Cubamyces sp. BRFM 1775]
MDQGLSLKLETPCYCSPLQLFAALCKDSTKNQGICSSMRVTVYRVQDLVVANDMICRAKNLMSLLARDMIAVEVKCMHWWSYAFTGTLGLMKPRPWS